MNDFISYSARMENAGIFSLWISLGHDKDGWRLMHVSPSSAVPGDIAMKFPTRTFRIDGTDPVLQELKDEICFNDATADQVKAWCLMNLPQAQDLQEFYADWIAMNKLEESDADMPTDVEVSESVKRTMQFTKGLMRGMDAAREQAAMKGEKP